MPLSINIIIELALKVGYFKLRYFKTGKSEPKNRPE